MKNHQIVRTLLLAGILFMTTLVASSQSIIAYATITSAKSGPIKGNGIGANEGKIECTGFMYGVTIPHDVSTGMALGKRIQQPVRIIKMIDAATPQLLQAAYNNEVLKSVVIEFVKRSATGQMAVFYKITLTNATISAVSQNINEKTNTPSEEITLSFQKIEVTSTEGNKTASDDWTAAH